MTSPRRTEQLIRHLARLPMGPADAFERALATGLAAAIGLGLWALDGLGAVRPDAGLGAPVIAVAIRFGGGLALFVIALIWLRDAARPRERRQPAAGAGRARWRSRCWRWRCG
ncbi:MAG: hypothetical protein KatS3mg118_2983 [Paracoccaceae bacterium]|nr:MAG: hypothetical protein KatS3mg118_2983 [Paracoccaceae bacterium]